ncbi:MAG: LytR C-terminal domain-containing protein [Calditrichaceae bacterium]|nr:LytR C-terminal domain-containing protein [Calditrichaceae bacterium]MBN2707903.1 LytR C-terminal domain-containing protein [Calditrichaceae bacterium]RQV97849.1 MAG: LytR family transcriptional regulator [Calditrichota bacterium]
MRRRRRLSTQTIQRKSYTTSTRSVSGKKQVNFGKIILYLFILTLIIYGGYWVVNNSGKFFGSDSDSTLTDLRDIGREEKPRLPAVNDEDTEDNNLPAYSPIKRKIQVEILNGCGVKGIAKLMADRLKPYKYDVVNSANYIEKGKENFMVPESRLIDQLNTSDNLANTRDLAEIIGISLGKIESHENSSPLADISIIIGRDYKKLKIFK